MIFLLVLRLRLSGKSTQWWRCARRLRTIARACRQQVGRNLICLRAFRVFGGKVKDDACFRFFAWACSLRWSNQD